MVSLSLDLSTVGVLSSLYCDGEMLHLLYLSDRCIDKLDDTKNACSEKMEEVAGVDFKTMREVFDTDWLEGIDGTTKEWELPLRLLTTDGTTKLPLRLDPLKNK